MILTKNTTSSYISIKINEQWVQFNTSYANGNMIYNWIYENIY